LGLRRRRAEEQEREGGGGEATSRKRSEVRVREVLGEGGVGVDLLGWWEGVFAKCFWGFLQKRPYIVFLFFLSK
jgi:predicted alpha/beta hydrolase